MLGGIYSLEIRNTENTYLTGSYSSSYVSELMGKLDVLRPYLNRSQLNCLVKDLQLEGETFDEVKYIQAACETAVSASLASEFPNNFKYEDKVNPPKDVDCSFENLGVRFNVEIKCPDYSKKNAIEDDECFSLGAFGRLSNYEDVFQTLDELFNKPEEGKEDADKPLVKQHHMDNKLKDYLISAHSKFSDNPGENELNVLLVCCSDQMDIQKWFFYMYGVQGLFCEDSFFNTSEYENVDVVVLTNLYHRHHAYWDKEKLESHWSFSKSFNLIFSNPYRKEDKMDCISKLVDSIHNHSNGLANYRVAQGLDELRIVHYVLEELSSKGLNYFHHASNN